MLALMWNSHGWLTFDEGRGWGKMCFMRRVNKNLIKLGYPKKLSKKEIEEFWVKIRDEQSGIISAGRLLFKHTDCSKYLNACALFGKVRVNAVWIAHLISDYSGAKEAFADTIGHELTHLQGDFPNIKLFAHRYKFISYVNEIHADFGGVSIALNGDSELGVKCLEFKKEWNTSKIKKNDKNYWDHPSWSKRIDYIKRKKFDTFLIREIAEDVGCTDSKLINSVSRYYEEIELK